MQMQRACTVPFQLSTSGGLSQRVPDLKFVKGVLVNVRVGMLNGI